MPTKVGWIRIQHRVQRRNTKRDTWALALNKTQGKLQPGRLSGGNTIRLLTMRTSPICSHQPSWWSSQGKQPHTTQPCNKTGKLEPINIFNMQSDIFTSSHPHSNQTCYDSSFNTLRLDSTHPDTYNSVGFSGCLHLWWIPLLDPELLDPELCVTSVTMNQKSLPPQG